MRTCPACGQLAPPRWGNAGRTITRLSHHAGPVTAVKAPASPGYPWGRIIDRVQSCTRCATTLVRGPWALFFDPGASVIEHGAGSPAAIIGDADHDDSAQPCA